MRTIQMTLDDELVKTVDAISKELNTSRSAFTRHALQEAVKQHNVERLELRHRQGYAVHPVNKEEFNVWEKEQDWGDE
jgi:metal-responsive CopG/Arc/MetJ family transcriptional regulator